jgi:Uma2 family endonuclease
VGVLDEKLTRERFRELYADRKPYFELIDGQPEQKALGTKRHAFLQAILSEMLQELGFRAGTELTLAISEYWEPIPDVAGMLGPDPEPDEPYPTRPIAVAIEILSPSDRFTPLHRKCHRYAEWGIPDILVFDPVEYLTWTWDHKTAGLVRVDVVYHFRSAPDRELSLAGVFRRLDEIHSRKESS